jgi:hypothetical protein
VLCAASACEDPDVTSAEREPVPDEADEVAAAPIVVGDSVVPPTADQAACIERLSAETPAEVRTTLYDLGWVDFFGDACGATLALRDRAPERCDELSARALRERCRLRVAMALRDVAPCPTELGGHGHDPLCVALARGEVALCAGVSGTHRALCDALLARDPERCAGLSAAEARCRAEHAELAALVPPAPSTPLDIPSPSLTLEVRRVVPSSAGDVVSEPSTVTLASLERGAVLVIEAGAMRLYAGEAALRASEAALQMELELAAPPDGAGTIEATLALGTEARIDLRLPETAALTPGTGEVVVTTLEPRIGGRVEGSLDVELFAPIGSVRVSGHFRTFVRDTTTTP